MDTDNSVEGLRGSRDWVEEGAVGDICNTVNRKSIYKNKVKIIKKRKNTKYEASGLWNVVLESRGYKKV